MSTRLPVTTRGAAWATAAAGFSSACGMSSSNQNRVPCPGLLCTRSMPPMRLTYSMAMDVPRPVPPNLRLDPVSTW